MVRSAALKTFQRVPLLVFAVIGLSTTARADAPASTGSQDPAALAARIAQLEQQMAQLTSSKSSSKVDFGIPLHGFADTTAGWSGGGMDPGPVVLRGFNAGSIEFYLTPNYERLRSLFELRFEFDKGGGGLGNDLERAQLGYEIADNTVIWFGRFHIPEGYWNTAFHHGAYIQTAVTRPRFIEFEDSGGVLPTHGVGGWLTGKLRAGGSGMFTYDLFVSNESRIVGDDKDSGGSLDYNGYTDSNYGKMFGGRFGWQFAGALDGLETGIFGYRDTINAYSDGNPNYNSDPSNIYNRNDLTVGGAYAAYTSDELELVSEWYHISTDTKFINAGPGTLGNHSSDLWFAQGAYTWRDFVPYVRVEEAALNADDPLFSDNEYGRPYRRASLGLRYNLNSRAAVKLDASRTHEDLNARLDFNTGSTTPASSPTNYSRLMMQFAIRF